MIEPDFLSIGIRFQIFNGMGISKNRSGTTSKTFWETTAGSEKGIED